MPLIRPTPPMPPLAKPRLSLRALAELVGFFALCAVAAASAIVTKHAVHRSHLDTLAGISTQDSPPTSISIVSTEQPPAESNPTVHDPLGAKSEIPNPKSPIEVAAIPESSLPADDGLTYAVSTDIRYFNARPVRPARTITMTVTAYSPDEQSCGPDARGITSSVHHVGTNNMKLVAADTRILPLGSMVSIPGYDAERIVPVLDRGGAIKGNRLDVLFPTHGQAMKWGVKKLGVTIWEYADNLPPDDYRRIRDSRK